jgi:hypothetical protein
MAYSPPTPYTGLSGAVTYGTGLQLVDEVLTNLAKQFAPDGYIYERLVSPMPVDYNIGRYPVFDPSTFFATGGMLEVADDAPTPIIDFNWSHDVYQCLDRRLATRVTRKEALQANPALRLDYSKTRGLLTVFANNREDRLAKRLRAQSNGGQFTNAVITPAVKWDAGTSGSPATIQQDVQNGLLIAMKACGKRPNSIVLDYEVALAISNDYTVKQQLQYRIGPEMLSNQLADSLAGNGNGGGVLPPKLFGLNVIVADGVLQNTSRPGQSMTLAGTWGTSARLIYVDPNAQWGEPATAYSFRGRVVETGHQPPASIMPTGQGGAEPGPAGGWAVVDRWWDYDPPGENIRAWECVDERIVAPELGVEIGSVLTPTSYEY